MTEGMVSMNKKCGLPGKRALCAVLILGLLFPVFSYGQETVKDYENHWAASSIDFVIEAGYMTCTEGLEMKAACSGETEIPVRVFAPDAAMTRAMFVEALAGAAGICFESGSQAAGSDAEQWGLVELRPEIYEPDLKALDEMFDDMDGTEAFAPAVAWAVEQGIVNGTGTGFSPDMPLDRQTLAVLLYRAVDVLQIDLLGDWSVILDFTDLDQADQWAIEGISYCFATGLMNGDSSGAFSPKRTLTRAESAVVLERFCRQKNSV